jgi:signal peptidase I
VTDPATRRGSGHAFGARGYFVAFLVAIILALFTRTFLVQAFRIPTPSMEPTLRVGDHLLVDKFIYGSLRTGSAAPAWLPARGIRRGDVVVFRSPVDPGRNLIKRCLGLPGETVAGRGGGVWIDGRPLAEEGYRHPGGGAVDAEADGGWDFGPVVVPAGRYFCFGDHRDASLDSRAWGPVPASAVVGRALLIYASCGDDPCRDDPSGDDPSGNDPSGAREGVWGKIVQTLDTLFGWVWRCRWERTLRPVR